MGRVTVKVVLEEGCGLRLDEPIAASLRDLHPGLRCRVEKVDEIPSEPSGKFKQVVSRIGRPPAPPHVA